MKRDALQQILAQANAMQAAGAAGERPWYVVLLLAIGAWLAAVPLLVPIGAALQALDAGDVGNAVIGALSMAGAVWCLRRPALPIFAEQAALPVMLAGGSVLGYYLFKLWEQQAGGLAMSATALAIACLVPQAWLRSVLGCISAAVLLALFFPAGGRAMFHDLLWFALHANAALWLLGRRLARTPQHGLVLDPFLAGWLALTLAGLAFWSGPAMLTPGADLQQALLRPSQPQLLLTCAVSLACSVAAAVLLARALPALRQWWCLGVALTVAGFTFFLPAIGVVLLLLAACVADGRYRLAAAAGLTAAWAVSSAYYDLALSLAHKSALFALAGALLLAFCLLPLRARPRLQPARAGHAQGRAGVALCGVAVLAVANFSIWRNEDLIAHSQAAYVELAPVDPRSLVQGDFMRLAVKLPPAALSITFGGKAKAAGRLRQDNVLELLRFADGPARPGEILVELEKKNGTWMLASDAWYFKEGEAARYQKARYGEYRIAPSGRALLVGMRGPKLEPL